MDDIIKIINNYFIDYFPLLILEINIYYKENKCDIYVNINTCKYIYIKIFPKVFYPDSIIYSIIYHKSHNCTLENETDSMDITTYKNELSKLDKEYLSHFIHTIIKYLKDNIIFTTYYHSLILYDKINRLNLVVLQHLKVDIKENKDLYTLLDNIYNDYNGLGEYHELKDRFNREDWF